MNEDWRTIYRKPDAPAPAVGDRIEGMERDERGEWVVIEAPVEAVELAETKPDGGRFYRVLLGKSVKVETP